MEKKEKKINKVEEYLTVILLLVTLAILSYQVFLRFVLNNSNSWSEELARYLFIWSVYSSAAYAIISNAHIRIDAVVKLYPKKIRRFVPFFADVVFLIYAIVVAAFSTRYCLDLYATHQVSMGLHVVMAYMYAAIPVGHALMAIRLVQALYKRIRYPELYEE